MTGEIAKEVFISYSRKDRDAAQELAAELHRLGCTTFLDTQSIPAASDGEALIVQNLRGARVVAVLLSQRSLEAHYQREEIRLVIKAFREEAPHLKIAPVRLEESTDPLVGFGLGGFQEIPLWEIGVRKTARRIAELLGKGGAPAPGGRDPDPDPPHTYGAYFHRAALKIDRTDQWLPIQTVCSGRESALFLLPGPRQENLDLFVGRLGGFLSAESRQHHRFCEIPLAVNGLRPRTADGWETHLVHGLSRRGRKGGRRGGKTVDLLREAARDQSLFLIINRLPLGAGDLDEPELEAFEDFLSHVLPRLMREASKGVNPIRALITTHYDHEGDPLTERLDKKALAGCKSVSLLYQRLPEVRPLKWSDVKAYLFSRAERPADHVFRRLEEMFQRLDTGSLQFRDVVELLEREVGE